MGGRRRTGPVIRRWLAGSAGAFPPGPKYLFIYLFLFYNIICGSALPTVRGFTATVFMVRRCQPCAALPPLYLWFGAADRVRFYRH